MPMLDVDGSKLFYIVKGAGIPIIFIHPPLITSQIFHYQLEELSQKYKVIIFDIRGHGRSHSSNQLITYPLIVEDVKYLLNHLGIDKAFISGYSAGGSVVLEFLLTYADRSLGGIIISGMSEVSDWYQKQRISLAKGLSNSKTLSLLSLSISWGNSDKQETFRILHNEALKGNVSNIGQYFRYSLYYNCTRRLKRIKLPVLLAYGMKDKPFHRYAKLLHENLPHRDLEFLENEKHQLPTKAARRLNSLIGQFIKSRRE